MVLTTHYMEEAERLCDTLVIMDRGRVIATGAPADLVRQHAGSEVVELRVPEVNESAVLAGVSLDGVTTERAGDVRLFFLDRHSALTDRLVDQARLAHVPCLLRNATLEDVFLRLTGRDLSE
jgi:lipooligosaccharide transport system ATP-binding protein